jgi:hypothetical protein
MPARDCVGFVAIDLDIDNDLCDHLMEDGRCAFFTDGDLKIDIMCDMYRDIPNLNREIRTI